jgi:aldehyde dehydrogenase (NAD+)
MREYAKFYIGGEWTDPAGSRTMDVVNPATEEVCGTVAVGSADDVHVAVTAARKAFDGWSVSSVKDRLDLLGQISEVYQKRAGDLAAALTEEMGAPSTLANGFQVNLAAGHLATAIEVLKNFSFSEQRGGTLVVKEPIGVCGLPNRNAVRTGWRAMDSLNRRRFLTGWREPWHCPGSS